jgi:hypothetical protein
MADEHRKGSSGISGACSVPLPRHFYGAAGI